ncbi:hypothetical protein AB0N16_40490 [Streptomyces sp. NPDC051105]|uniref:hypothetical protein n=1 Tax=Streptomyces sp. NPDC051105 TaxID=3154843 RepID=UPI0034257C7C
MPKSRGARSSGIGKVRRPSLLLDGTWTRSGEVACLGPEDLSPNGMARIVSETLGTEVGYRQITGAAVKERMTGFGMSGGMAQGLVDMFEAKNRGLDHAEPRAAESTTPTTFRQGARRYSGRP